MNKSSLLKKSFILIGSLFGLLVALAVLIPFFVNVDKFRPQIMEAANQQMNGKLELGKLSLSLWGQIKVDISGMALLDSQNRKILSVKEAHFHLPFTSVFSGTPVLTLSMQEPEVNVVKSKAGKMNVLTLMKDVPKGESPKTETSAPVATKKTESAELPSLVKNARFGFEMKNARLLYKDELTDLTSQINELNVKARDISLTKKMQVEVRANLDTKMGKQMVIKGPMEFLLNMNPEFKGSEFVSSELGFTADLDKIEILIPGSFEKKKGVASNAKGTLKVTSDSAVIKELQLNFFNIEIKGSGSVEGFSSKPEPQINLSFKSNEFSLKPWAELAPALKESLKADPILSAAVKVGTDQIESMALTMKAPSNDLKVHGKVVSFKKPKVDIVVSSTGMDLDSLMNFPKKPVPQTAPAGAQDSKSVGEKPSNEKGQPAVADLDSLLDPLRENPIVRDAQVAMKVSFAFIKAYEAKMTDIAATASMKGLTLNLDSFKMGLFGGTVNANMTSNLLPKRPTYQLHADVSNLDLQKAIESQMAMFKNTLIGIASFKMDGSGSSFVPDLAKKNLNAKGTFKAENAKFATIDIGKAVTEAINKSLGSIGEKVPALKGKTLSAPGNIDSKYALVSSDFTISGGTFSAPNFVAKAEPQKGLDVKGDTKVGLIDMGLNANWEIVDTYNLTKAKDLSVDYQGVHVPNILADSDSAVHIPIQVTGTCLAPQMNYLKVPESLGKVALNNTGKALTGKAKTEAKKKIEEMVQKEAPPQLKDALKGLGGKLFGN